MSVRISILFLGALIIEGHFTGQSSLGLLLRLDLPRHLLVRKILLDSRLIIIILIEVFLDRLRRIVVKVLIIHRTVDFILNEVGLLLIGHYLILLFYYIRLILSNNVNEISNYTKNV